MNFLSELIFGKKETNHLTNTTTYNVFYCPYYHIMSGMGGIDTTQSKIDGIEKNEPFCSSTFPDFNEKIINKDHYDQVINDLEKHYTKQAFDNKQIIKITKQINPKTFNYKDKEYDLSLYHFVVDIK